MTSEQNGKLDAGASPNRRADRHACAELLTCAEGLSNGELLRNCRSPRLLFVNEGNAWTAWRDATSQAKRSALDSDALVEDAVSRTKTL